MNHFKLRDYQQNIIDSVNYHLHTNNRCCVSLATGGGKTVIFSELVNYLQGKILICVHREELVYQTSNTLKAEHDLLLPKTKAVSKDIVVAMVQTLHNRIKRGVIDINSFDNIIIDEAHRGEFMKIIQHFKGKVIGFTATPNYEKTRYFYKCLICGKEHDVSKDCCKHKTKKYKQNIPLATYYHTLIDGIQIPELIEKGFLVQDENYVLNIDTSRLVWDDIRNDYTEESISLVFGSDEAIENTIKVFKELALNKKTIIFNPNTLVNKKLYQKMALDGLNVKMYDSNNSDENRKELIEWFKNTKDAILLNVQVFTTGFDCTDVEVIFLNKKTKSLNLYLQMVGRGGRITDKILKPSFMVIDMGNNNQDFGNWSKLRNWDNLFYKTEIKTVGTPKPTAVRTCHSCEAIVPANSLICPICKTERSYAGVSNSVTGLPIRNGKPIIPSPQKIVKYCEENNLDCLDARKIVYDYVSKMFYGVSLERFAKAKSSDELFRKTQIFIKPYYFAIQKSELKGNKIRKLYHFTNETIRQIERRHYSTANISVVSQ
jgi:superfamily II DNA or RNA helicase